MESKSRLLYFQFHNSDLNKEHTYEVFCDEYGDTLDINIMMGNAEADNNILGSFVIDIPQKEFEKLKSQAPLVKFFIYNKFRCVNRCKQIICKSGYRI